MLLKRPFLISAVFSLKDFLGKSDMAGVEYSNGGSARWGTISSILVDIGGGGMGGILSSA